VFHSRKTSHKCSSSSLTPFSFNVQEIDGTVAINPGRAIKGDSLGTFGVLTVHPPSEATSEVHKRTRAEIIHL
jgi:hypothetical protein